MSSEPTTPSRRAVLTMGLAGAATLAGCTAGQPASSPSTPPTSPAVPASPPSPSAAPAVGGPTILRLDQSVADAKRTVASLRRLDAHPTYAVDWYGAAPVIDGKVPAAVATATDPFACTLFAAYGDPGRVLVGRNFDWDPHAALVVHTRASGAPESIGLLDMPEVDLDRPDLLDTRFRIVRAGAGLMDGMNAHGLFLGFAAVDCDNRSVAGAPPISGLGALRVTLDRARTVEEALAVLKGLSIDFTGGPGLHYLLADRGGHAAVVEFVRGELVVERPPAGQPWAVMENFMLAEVPAAQRTGGRYAVCARALESSRGRLDESGAFGLLDEVRQGHTQWTAVYDLTAGTLALRTAKGRRDPHRFSVTPG